MFSFFNGFNRKIISLNPKSKQCHNVCQWNWMICKNIIIAIFTQSKELKKTSSSTHQSSVVFALQSSWSILGISKRRGHSKSDDIQKDQNFESTVHFVLEYSQTGTSEEL